MDDDELMRELVEGGEERSLPGAGDAPAACACHSGARGGREYVFSFDLSTWGWVHLLLGILVIAAGVGVRTGQLWGRSVGIGLVAISMLGNFLFLPYYPAWSLLIIVLDFFVIWALCVYNEDAARA